MFNSQTSQTALQCSKLRCVIERRSLRAALCTPVDANYVFVFISGSVHSLPEQIYPYILLWRGNHGQAMTLASDTFFWRGSIIST